jgi:hypothetical protein
MAILSTGNTYVTNDQVTAANLNSAVNGATFASGAVDNATTQLSGGAVIVKDKGVTASKLESGSNGQLFIGNGTGFTKATLTAGSNVTITNGAGSITIASTASGGGGTIGGSTGSTDNRIIRADGTGGSTIKSSAIAIDDSGNVTGGVTADFTTSYKVNGTQVVGAQGAVINDTGSGATISGTGDDAGINANFSIAFDRINLILARLRAHGLIDT